MAKLIVDGNWAAADVAYRCVDCAAIYPITPSSTMVEWLGKIYLTNIFVVL